MTDEVMIMIAPNGARKTRQDHANIPLTIEDTVAEAIQCHRAGASILHAHVRGSELKHVLDPGLYRELIDELAVEVPELLVQITSESVGRYSPEGQIACVQAVHPQMVSMSLREITANFVDVDIARNFFSWCEGNEVHIQHILYSIAELEHFFRFRDQSIIPSSQGCVLFVLGRYRQNFQSDPSELELFLQYDLSDLDWFACAFGHREQECVMKAVESGGHARVGFENNLHLPSGDLADGNADLLYSLREALRNGNFVPATGNRARNLLKIP